MDQIEREKKNFDQRMEGYLAEDKDLSELEMQKKLIKVDNIMDETKSNNRKRRIERGEADIQRKRMKREETKAKESQIKNPVLRPQLQVISRPLPKLIHDTKVTQRPYVFRFLVTYSSAITLYFFVSAVN